MLVKHLPHWSQALLLILPSQVFRALLAHRLVAAFLEARKPYVLAVCKWTLAPKARCHRVLRLGTYLTITVGHGGEFNAPICFHSYRSRWYPLC